MNNVSIALFCSVVGAVVGILGFMRVYKKDTQEETANNAEIKTDMNYIKRGIDDIRIDIKTQDRRISEVIERVVRVEESSKSAHHRLDSLVKGD